MLDKLGFMVHSLEEEHGLMLFAALFLRKHSLKKWDLIVSAPWLNPDERKAYEMIAFKAEAVLTPDEFASLSRAVVLDNTDPAVSFLQEVCPLTNGGIKESPKDFSVEPLSEKFGFIIEKAYILRSQKI